MQSQGMGAGPYPGEVCCGCFEIKMGMTVLSVLIIFNCIALPFSCLAYMFGPWGGNAGIIAFALVGAFLLTLIFFSGYVCARWL